jgi:hypothetical protein
MASHFIFVRPQYSAKKFRFECRVIKEKIQRVILLNPYCFRQSETLRLSRIFVGLLVKTKMHSHDI